MPRWIGKVSWFGGPEDEGVAPSEGLAFFQEVEDAPNLFLDEQPEGTTGLARRLDPDTFYIAMRWDYDEYSKEMLASGSCVALIFAPRTLKCCIAVPADWGPHKDTGRIADVSPAVLEALAIETDDVVEVTWPVLWTY